eukprot:10683588-Ditylum_brightwellii.AAC.1
MHDMLSQLEHAVDNEITLCFSSSRAIVVNTCYQFVLFMHYAKGIIGETWVEAIQPNESLLSHGYQNHVLIQLKELFIDLVSHWVWNGNDVDAPIDKNNCCAIAISHLEQNCCIIGVRKAYSK